MEIKGEAVTQKEETKEVAKPLKSPSTTSELLSLAAYNSITYLIMNLTDFMTHYFIGLMGKKEYTGIAGLGNNWLVVSSYSVLLGLTSTVNTFVSQSFGRKMFYECGNAYYRAAFLAFFLCIPFSFLLYFGGTFLTLIGIDSATASAAETFSAYLIPHLFFRIQYELLQEFLNAQKIAAPITIITIVTTFTHPIWCVAFMLESPELGLFGAAVAKSITSAFSFVLLVIYIRASGCCKRTLGPFALKNVFKDLKGFLRVAVNGALMSCLDSWAFEFIGLMSGIIGSDELSVSVATSQINLLIFMIPVGFGKSVGALVGNSYGAGNYSACRSYIKKGAMLNNAVTGVAVCYLIVFRRKISALFFDDEDILTLFSQLIVVLAFMMLFDSTQGFLARVLPALGKQGKATTAVLISYYIVMLPAAYCFLFLLEKGLFGLWAANFLAAVTLAGLYGCIVWKEFAAVDKAKAE
eukprot:TRINITY_DN1513_c0_g1_i2.p1 TRINITY_DN1513_c0_g1~~TRINITY_DN1513_c0_g1_i2.p1  ORF type:complete len:466 (-),score=82.23 TRINITY_DN1513_c0_g1_i2:157-1554(-)